MYISSRGGTLNSFTFTHSQCINMITLKKRLMEQCYASQNVLISYNTLLNLGNDKVLEYPVSIKSH